MKEILLTNGGFALIDDEDYEKVNRYKWYRFKKRKACYAYSTTGHIYMHRLIMDFPIVKVIDHIDFDGLNNQKNNLRLCSNKENLFNTKAYINNKLGLKGIKFRKGKYDVYSSLNGKQYWAGRFGDITEAKIAYNNLSQRLYGEFAYQHIL